MNCQGQMKFYIVIIFLSFVIVKSSNRHEVVFRGGKAIGGYVSEMTHDSLKLIPEVGIPTSLDLDSILYVHDSSGKLFYLSSDIRQFFNRAKGRGGVITTIYGEDIYYNSLDRELFMFEPKVVYNHKGSQDRIELQLVEIHKVRLNHTVSEYAVKKGVIAGASLTTILFFAKFKAIKEFLNFSKLFKTGNKAYKTATTIIPISSIGWVVFDFFKGERELILNPLKDK